MSCKGSKKSEKRKRSDGAWRSVWGNGEALRRRVRTGAHNLNMTQLALNLSEYVNGVAKQHAETSVHMFPGYRVRAVTNGVHAPTLGQPVDAPVVRYPPTRLAS